MLIMRDIGTTTFVALAMGGVISPSLAFSQQMDTPKLAKSAQASVDENKIYLASDTVTQMTNWILASADNHGMPFVVIDKISAEVFVFDAHAQLLGATPALLGIAQGDSSVPGIGHSDLANIRPADRTTPAGRFLAGFGRASGNRNVLWVDYPTSISLHPVVTTNKKERRLQRLASHSPKDNRITYGCINVSATFYNKIIRPLFTRTNGLVYILPETRPVEEVFPTFRRQLTERSERSP